MDHVVCVPRLPMAGETLAATASQTVAGGKGANQAIAAARLGCRVVMVGRVGDDVLGSTLLRGLVESAVDARFVERDLCAATGMAFIFVAENGQNSIMLIAGANANLTPEHVLAAEDVLCKVSVLVTQLEIPLGTAERALELARQNRVTTILNPAPAQPLPQRLFGLVDFLILNETEAGLLTGSQIDGVAAAGSVAAKLRAWGGTTVILTLGGEGALLVDEEEVHLVAHQVPVVDSTAAGDAFVGAFAAAIAEGKSPREAVRWANAAGALAATRLGAQPSLPFRDELEAFLKRDQYRRYSQEAPAQPGDLCEGAGLGF